MSIDKFTIGENRARPPYQVKTSRCTACNAPLSLYSEQSQLIVCQYCGENLDCSEEELKALGKSDQPNVGFELSLDQDFLWDDVKYKVIARMLFEDQIYGFKTTEYLLFHPLQGTRWLSLYRGEDGLELAISEEKHSLAMKNPFQDSDNVKIRTGDQRVWVKDSETEMLLKYVDGALPWLAKTGDSTQSIEYMQSDKESSFLTAEQTTLGSMEIEYSFSKEISFQQYRKAIGDQTSAEIFFEKSSGAVAEIHSKIYPFVRIAILIIAILGLGIFGFLGFQSGGEDLASFSFTPEIAKVERGVVSPSFTVTKEDLSRPLFLQFQGQKYLYQDLVLIKVAETSNEYIDLEKWEKREDGAGNADQTMVEEMFVFDSYPDSEGKAEEMFALLEEGIYRVHLRYSRYTRDELTKNTNVVITKQIPLSRYYLVMFGCCIWTLLVWRKL